MTASLKNALSAHCLPGDKGAMGLDTAIVKFI
jgi:hypothetical protein